MHNRQFLGKCRPEEDLRLQAKVSTSSLPSFDVTHWEIALVQVTQPLSYMTDGVSQMYKWIFWKTKML